VNTRRIDELCRQINAGYSARGRLNQPSTFSRLSQQTLAWTLKSHWQEPRTLSGLHEITATFRSEK